ncbi:hypothetical protein GGX14DRAFT_537525 [Mycena pura]|uniref:Malate dehydrogenase n=1 Tax=Mycena pura TaxID=153505 RepID=A0AAD6Y0I5_9AGAR|nr:hypothetical protein GGX14DRAFT_537525 [Mycena pura]
MFARKLICALSAALLVSAVPAPDAITDCSTAPAEMDLAAGQTQLVSPTTAPLFVALGVGVQNYTCTATTSKYTSTGAVASLFDISCLDKFAPAFEEIQTIAFDVWKLLPASAPPLSPIIPLIHSNQFHYFITSPSGAGISPKWDFTSTGKFAGDASAFVLGAKVGDIVAPTNPATNIDWLALNNAGNGGTLANHIFRIDTVNGQPPTSCTPGSADISVKYTAKYFLY